MKDERVDTTDGTGPQVSRRRPRDNEGRLPGDAAEGEEQTSARNVEEAFDEAIMRLPPG